MFLTGRYYGPPIADKMSSKTAKIQKMGKAMTLYLYKEFVGHFSVKKKTK